MQATFLKLLLMRVKSKSPVFYVKLRWISGLCAFLMGAIMVIMKVNYLNLDPSLAANIYDVCSKIGAGITGAWGLTWTGTADPALLESTPEGQG